MRRVGYGNATHLNMSVIVGGDNKAIIQVALDRQDKDYFACDAGKFEKLFETLSLQCSFSRYLRKQAKNANFFLKLCHVFLNFGI